MPRRKWDNEEAARLKGAGWNHLGLRDTVGQRGTRKGEVSPFPPHVSHISKLLGEPRPGESALDRKRALAEIAAPVEHFRVDWSKMAIGARRADYDETPLEGDVDE